MRTVTYYYSTGKISPYADVVALKIAMLFADVVVSASTLEIWCDIGAWYRKIAPDTKGKLLALRQKDKHDEQWQKEVNNSLDFLKKYNRNRNKNAQMIYAVKQFEKKIAGIFDKYVETIENFAVTSGLQELVKLLGGSNAGLIVYRLSTGNVENGEDDSMPVSEILLSIGYPVDDGPEIFLLHHDFFGSPFIDDRKVYSVYEAEAENIAHIYMEPLLSFPNLYMINAPEVIAVKKQLKEPGAAFRQAIDKWVDLALKNSDSIARMSFFKEQVIPAAQWLQQAIDNNAILAGYSRQAKESNAIQVMVGEMPPTTVWDFYKQHGIVGGETWEILEKERKDDPQYEQRFPVMALKADFTWSKKDEKANDEVQHVKKSISVD